MNSKRGSKVHAVLSTDKSGYILVLIPPNNLALMARDQLFCQSDKRMIIVYSHETKTKVGSQTEKQGFLCSYSYVDKLTKNTYTPVSAT